MGRWLFFQSSAAYLLDTYTGAAAAYSLRQLKTGVTSVVKVRRTVGSPATADFTAAEITDGTLATWVGVGNNGFVDTWYDQSGNSRHGLQAVTTKQFIIVSNGVVELQNGKPCVKYNNSGVSFVKTASISGISQPTTAVSVSKADTTNAQICYDGTASLSGSLTVTNSTTLRNYAGTALNLTVANAFTTRWLSWLLFNGASSQIAANGGSLTTGNAGSANMGGVTVGAGASEAAEWRGTIQEVIIFSGDKVSDRTGIQTEINTHYAIY